MTKPKTIKFVLTILIFVFLIKSCSIHWTEKERQEFAQKCSQTDTADNLTFMVTGFDYNEIENIGVLQIHNGHTVDSFYVHPHKGSFDSLRTRYTTSLDKTLHINDTYEFLIPEQKPFVLSDMKMVMWAQYSMFSEGYGCVMGDYKIDGVRFEHNANPDFIKKGFKFSWDK